MNRLQLVSSPYLDLVSSHLRSQVVQLETLLDEIESKNNYEEDYTKIKIKTVEAQLRRLRKFIESQE